MCVRVCDPFSVRYAHSSSGIIFVSGIWYGQWTHELFLVNSKAPVVLCVWFVYVRLDNFSFFSFLANNKIDENMPDLMANDDGTLLTCYRLSQRWQWCDDVDEKKKKHWKNQKIIQFLSDLYLCHFFASWNVVFCWHNNILCVFQFCICSFYFCIKKVESSNFSFIQLYISIIWYYRDEFVFNIYINIYLFLWSVHESY